MYEKTMRNSCLSVLLLLLDIGVVRVWVLNANPCGPPPIYDYAQPDQKYMKIPKYIDGDKVRYSCTNDYDPTQGHFFIQCVNGIWSKLTLKCEKRSCGDAGVLQNGFFEYSGGVSVGDRVHVVCNNGYTLKGMEYLVCKKSGWSPEHPTCEDLTLSLTHDSVSETICPLPSITNGVKMNSDVPVYRVGDSVTFTCSQGFTLIGHQHVTCGSTGQWDPKLPECRPAHDIGCKPIVNDLTMIINPKNVYKPGETLSYSCKENSNANQSVATCGPNGAWIPPLVKCERIKCPELVISNAKPSSKRRRANSIINVRCNKGYELQGPANIVCLQNGMWDSIPKCVPGGCGVPTDVSKAHLSNAYILKNSFASGDRVRYECNIGYVRVSGLSYRTCENGMWTRLLLICERRQCGSAGEILNGQYTYTGASFGDTVTAVCDKGYQLFGKSVRTCTSEDWNGNPPVCEVVYCLAPPKVPNAFTSDTDVQYKYGTGLSYRCRVGRLTGNREIFCTEDGTWSGQPPQCRVY